MPTLKTTFALVLIAAAGFASVTYAEGDYYEGAQKNAVRQQRRPPVDRNYTGSVSHTAPVYDRLPDEKTIDSGDYYEGVQRPN